METNLKIKEKIYTKAKEPKNYKVIMYNDDFTTMEFVVAVLNIVFNKNFEEANNIMMEVHRAGKGIAGVYSYDIAVTKKNKAISMAREEGFPFKLTVEEE